MTIIVLQLILLGVILPTSDAEEASRISFEKNLDHYVDKMRAFAENSRFWEMAAAIFLENWPKRLILKEANFGQTMQEILNILFWAGTIAGGLLILLLLISIISGMEMGGDVDIAGGDADAHADGGDGDGSLGLLKSLLTFVSVGAFTARAIFMNTSWSWTLVVIGALVAGVLAVLLLTWLFRWLLKNQEEGTWHLWQAEGKEAKVYVPIPPGGKGRVIVRIDKVNREIAARSEKERTISTHEKVLVLEAKEDHVLVTPMEN